MSSASGYLGFRRTPPRLEPEPLEDMVLLIGLLVQHLVIVEENGLNICLKKKIKRRPALGVYTHTNNDMMENYSNSSKSYTPALGRDFDDLKVSVEQYLHSMRRPGPDPQGGRGPPGGARVQVAGVLIDHLSGLPAGPEAKPRSHTMTPEKGKEKKRGPRTSPREKKLYTPQMVYTVLLQLTWTYRLYLPGLFLDPKICAVEH